MILGAALTLAGNILLGTIVVGFLIWLITGPCNALANAVASLVRVGGWVLVIGLIIFFISLYFHLI